ncbi:uncharacterized protein LOC129778903 [Toxorhynchites rutilus septentrionalis]|uniref:uncharacterized protein LOC129778903 n=1 Tax=Toxorhynchites rutilus septentrionalis TaxID=329112 RepID=UPI00247A057B|nr:uncharacterized protein LOC129778903 [Toxorhynchites rutilus septentrionalis]
MCRNIYSWLVTVCLACICSKTLPSVAGSINNAGEGRFIPALLAIPSAPARHQMITGLGVPLTGPEAITTGWVFKVQYAVPASIAQLRPHLWEGWNETKPSIKKRDVASVLPGQHYENYTALDVAMDSEPLPDEDENDFDDGDDSYWLDGEDDTPPEDAQESIPSIESAEGYNAEHSRWTTYRTLEKIGETYGAGGRACVLRSICEAAEAKFTHTGGIFSELLHIIFTPSTTTESLSEHSDNEYYRAEQFGREGAPCHLIFQECSHSILDVFTGIHDPALDSVTIGHKQLLEKFMK